MVAKVSCQEIINKKTKARSKKIRDLKNIETLVLIPSYITVVSLPNLLTI
jgi:hypothetical protein